MGFQEAFARNRGLTQQTTLGQLFEGTKWRYHSWEAENQFNMNPIIVNTDRFMHVASGATTIDFEESLSDAEWQDYFDLHAFFHGNERGVHFLGPERYVTWVVVDDLLGGGRVAFLTSHYETFIGRNNKGAEYADDFERFSELVNRSFGYASEQIHAQAELLKSAWGDLAVIIGGDFETPNPELPSQKAFADVGYVETWRFVNGNGRRPTQGIDNLFVMLEGSTITIKDSFYDQADYTDDASDHKPLYAVMTLCEISCDPPPDSSFVRGDSNNDGSIDITDPVSNLQFQFLGTFKPTCVDSCDFDDNGEVEISDPIANLTHQFLGGPPAAPPGPHACDVDPTVDELGCESFAPCEAEG